MRIVLAAAPPLIKSLKNTATWERRSGGWYREPPTTQAKFREAQGTKLGGKAKGKDYQITQFDNPDKARVAHIINQLVEHAPDSKIVLHNDQIALARAPMPKGHQRMQAPPSNEYNQRTAGLHALLNTSPDHFDHFAPDGDERRGDVYSHSKGVGLHVPEGTEKPSWKPVKSLLARLSGSAPSTNLTEGVKRSVRLSDKQIEEAVAGGGFAPETADWLAGKIKGRREDLRQILASGDLPGDSNANAQFASRYGKARALQDQPVLANTGRLAGAPPGVKSAKDLQKLKQKIGTLIERGAAGEGWYRDSADKIREVAGNDVHKMQQLAALHAIYSPRYSPIPNSESAIRAFQHYTTGGSRETMRGGHTPEQEEQARALLYNNHWHEGVKTNAFYRNLMTELTNPQEANRPPREGEIQPATIDVWIARAMGYPVGGSAGGTEGTKQRGVNPSWFRFAQSLLNDVAREKGISTHRAQARMWVAMKSQELARERAITQYAQGKGQNVRDYLKKVGGVSAPQGPAELKQQLKGVTTDPRSESQAMENFAEGIERTRGHIISGLTPHSSSNMLEGIDKLPPEAKHELHEGLLRALHDEQGRLVPAELAGIGGTPAQRLGPHGHMMASPFMPKALLSEEQRKAIEAEQGSSAANLARKQIAPEQLQRVRGVSAAIAHMLGQKSIDFQRPIPGTGIKQDDLNATAIKTPHKLDERELAALQQAIAQRTGRDDITPVPYYGGVYFVNRANNIPNKDFHKLIKGAAEDVFNRPQMSLFGGASGQQKQYPDMEVGQLLAPGGRVEGDSEAHRQRAVADLGPDLSNRIFSQLTPRLAAVYKQFARKHGLKLNLPEAYRATAAEARGSTGAKKRQRVKTVLARAWGWFAGESENNEPPRTPSDTPCPSPRSVVLAKSLSETEDLVHSKHHNTLCIEHLNAARNALDYLAEFANIKELHKSAKKADLGDPFVRVRAVKYLPTGHIHEGFGDEWHAHIIEREGHKNKGGDYDFNHYERGFIDHHNQYHSEKDADRAIGNIVAKFGWMKTPNKPKLSAFLKSAAAAGNNSAIGEVVFQGTRVAQHLGSAEEETFHVVKHLKRTSKSQAAELSEKLHAVLKEALEKHPDLMRWLAERNSDGGMRQRLEKMFAASNAAYGQLNGIILIALEYAHQLDKLLPDAEEKTGGKIEKSGRSDATQSSSSGPLLVLKSIAPRPKQAKAKAAAPRRGTFVDPELSQLDNARVFGGRNPWFAVKAVRHQGKVYLGANHPAEHHEYIEDRIRRKVPRQVNDMAVDAPKHKNANMEQGFVGHNGRFYTQHEMDEVVRAGGNTLGKSSTGLTGIIKSLFRPAAERNSALSADSAIAARQTMQGLYRSPAIRFKGRVLEGNPGEGHSMITQRMLPHLFDPRTGAAQHRISYKNENDPNVVVHGFMTHKNEFHPYDTARANLQSTSGKKGYPFYPAVSYLAKSAVSTKPAMIVLAKAATREDAIRQVTALRNTKGRTPEEAHTALSLAAGMMKRHGIGEHEVGGSGGATNRTSAEAGTTNRASAATAAPFKSPKEFYTAAHNRTVGDRFGERAAGYFKVKPDEYSRVHKFYQGDPSRIHQYFSKHNKSWARWAKSQGPEYNESIASMLSPEYKPAAAVRKPRRGGVKLTEVGSNDRRDEYLAGQHIQSIKVAKSAHKLHYRTNFAGFPVSIENRKGTYRHWYDAAADRQGKTLQHYPYGYIRLTEGVDGDQVDCYLGPNENAANVYIVTTMKPPNFDRVDEQKIMLGFNSMLDAEHAFRMHYDDPRFLGSIQQMPLGEFRAKVFETKDKPALIRSLRPALIRSLAAKTASSKRLVVLRV